MAIDPMITESFDASPEEVMAKDARLLAGLGSGSPIILHLYRWKGPSLTYGYFIDPDRHLRPELLRSEGIGTARRPTGGGITFHLTDFAFSLLIPASSPYFTLNPEENYARINRRVADVVTRFTSNRCKPDLFDSPKSGPEKEIAPFCMAKATRFDLMIEGKKVGGAAQRVKAKQGLLHQGSLFLSPLPPGLPGRILPDESMVECITGRSGYLLERHTPEDLERARSDLRDLFKEMMYTFSG